MSKSRIDLGACLGSLAVVLACSSTSSREVVHKDTTNGGATTSGTAAAGPDNTAGASTLSATASASGTQSSTTSSTDGGVTSTAASITGSTGTQASTSAGGAATTDTATAVSMGSNGTDASSATGAGGASSTGAGTGGVLPGDVLFAEDFEDGTVGQQPAGWDNFIAWNANFDNPSGDTLALVDDSQAYAGTRSVHFHGGQNPAQLVRALPSGTNKLYVRAYVRLSRQLGNVPADQNPNHETLIAIRGTPGGANDEVRFGEIKGVIGTNEVPSDNIAPVMAQWNSGPSVPADTWACIEVAFLGDQPTHELHAWVDGSLVHSITDPTTQFQNGAMPASWLEGNFAEVVIGWHSFSNATVDVWMDELVVALSPIGC